MTIRLACALLPVLLGASLQAGEDPFDVRMRHAREAVEGGEAGAAARHLERALVIRPFDLEALGLALENAAGRADDRILWAERLGSALADEKGLLRAGDPRAVAAKTVAAGLQDRGRARGAAVAELAKLALDSEKRASKDTAWGLVALWASELGRELIRDTPALGAAHGAGFDYVLEVDRRHMDEVIKILKRVHSRAASATRFPKRS